MNILVNPKGSREQLSENFQSREFDCKCGGSCTATLISQLLVDKIQGIRNDVGPLKINSAYRCPAHNKKVGGGKQSQHLSGQAADLAKPDHMSIADFKKIVDEYFSEWDFGIGVYDSFIHVDVRPNGPARWTG